MKRAFRVALVLWVFASTLSVIPAQTAEAVSTNPAPVCSGATCTITFTYTGDFYSWTAPSGGNFILETWGAQGGGGSSYFGAGGMGGYAKGTATFTAGTTVYIYVGQQGFQSSSSTAYNGGGSGDNAINPYEGGYTGGGATHIATTSGLLENLSANQSSVLIVGGGGGGAGGSNNSSWTMYRADGGAGGGANGATGGTGSGTPGTGGTQTTAGTGSPSRTAPAFGRGGSVAVNSGNYTAGGGGGGGWYGGGNAGDAGAGGGGGSGYVGSLSASLNTLGSLTMPNPAGGTMTGNSGNGVARITYDNSPSISNFVSSQSTPTKSTSPISFTFTTSQNVSGVANSDFSNAGTATGCTFSVNASSGTSFTLTVSSCSEGTVIPQVIASSLYGTVTASNGPTANALTTTPIVIDRNAPTIASVSAPTNSTYSNNQTPTFTVVFSESITVTGTPRLTLTVGSVTKYANFLALTDSKTATFRYTVTTDPIEFDTDGISVSTSVDLNGGSISDLATNAISNLTFTAPTLTSVFVAQLPVAPTIDSVVATSGTLTIYFTPGAARGSTTSGYQYTTDNNTFKNRETGTLASPLVITTVSTGAAALVNGTGYRLRIRAVTNAGNSAISNLVNETPTAVSVLGDSTLVLTYGSSASTGAYSATGGTNTYTWSLGSSLTGITLSGTTVTASSSTPAGTYSQTVRATDGNSQVGTKSLTITVNKASTSISIALPGAATNAALGGAVTITATVPRAGAVNFMFGGTTISGCGSASAASTTAVCSWTPNALGSVSLTATFTPTDSSNFETSTTTTLSITVVNGVSTVTLSLTGGTTTPPKGQAINIIAAVDQAGRITFMIDGKRIPGCNNKVANVGNVSCSWKPAIQKETTITARLVPTNSVYNASSSSLRVQVVRRSGLR